MNKTLTLVFIAEVWMTIGQICFKKSADRLKKGDRYNFPINNERKLYLSPFFLLKCLWQYPVLLMGAVSMLVGLLFWLAALNSGDLNFVYLLGSVQYIIMLFAAHYFLQEKITVPKLIGTLLISLGIALTCFS